MEELHKIKKGLLKDNFKDRGVEQISGKQNRKWEHAADETVRGEQLAPGGHQQGNPLNRIPGSGLSYRYHGVVRMTWGRKGGRK